MPSQSRSGQSNQSPLQPTRMPGMRLAEKLGVVLRHVSCSNIASCKHSYSEKLSRVCRCSNWLSEAELVQRQGLHLPPLVGLFSSCSLNYHVLIIDVSHSSNQRRVLMHAGTRPSRLRSLTRPGDAEPNQVSTSNSTVPQHLQQLQGSSETSGSGLTHPRGSLTVRTTVKSELGGSDGSGSARTPGSVNIRVWKVGSLNPTA